MIISSSKFNRRIKIRRWLKVMAAWPIMIFMVWLTYNSIVDLINLNHLLGVIPKVKISGFINNISAFIGFLIFGFASIVPIAMLHSSIELLLKVPFSTKMGRYMIVFIILAFTAYGLWLDHHIRHNLIKYNYIECKSERELTLKYSSRTYVLDPSLCDKQE